MQEAMERVARALELPRPGETAIPNSLLTDPTVSSNAIRLYGVMVALTSPGIEVFGEHRVAFASADFAQRDLRLWALQSATGFGSDKTVTRALKELIRLGYVTEEHPAVKDRKGKLRKVLHAPTVYRLHPTPKPPVT